jgi:very-short-patch-repair endonuclease
MAKRRKSVASIFKNIRKQALKIPKTQKQKDAYLVKQAKKMDKNPTGPEKLFIKLLKELKIEFETQKIVGGKIFDFYIPHKNMLVEADGNYYHAKDLVLTEMNGMQRKAVKNDKRKDIIAKSYGYELERVWESDLNKNYELVKSRFKYLLV